MNEQQQTGGLDTQTAAAIALELNHAVEALRWALATATVTDPATRRDLNCYRMYCERACLHFVELAGIDPTTKTSENTHA